MPVLVKQMPGSGPQPGRRGAVAAGCDTEIQPEGSCDPDTVSPLSPLDNRNNCLASGRMREGIKTDRHSSGLLICSVFWTGSTSCTSGRHS